MQHLCLSNIHIDLNSQFTSSNYFNDNLLPIKFADWALFLNMSKQVISAYKKQDKIEQLALSCPVSFL